MASKRAQRRKACTGKTRFATHQAAAAAAAALRHNKPGTGLLTTYLCPFCSGYHFGHPPARVRQSIAARYQS